MDSLKTLAKGTRMRRAIEALLKGACAVEIPVGNVFATQVRYAALTFIEELKRMSTEEQTRWEINVPRDPSDPTADDGIIRRENGRASDQKVFLHVRPDLPALLTQRGIVLREPTSSWLSGVIRLRNYYTTASLLFASALDEVAPGFYARERVEEAEQGPNTGVLRVLVYHPGSRGYAKVHKDRNAFSLHAGASAPGLYFLDGDKKRIYEEPGSGKALAFPGNQLETVSAGRVRASAHGTFPPVNSLSRWAVVYFAKMAV